MDLYILEIKLVPKKRTLQLSSDGFILPSGNLKLGSGNYRFRELALGYTDVKDWNGFTMLPNGFILQWGRGGINDKHSGHRPLPMTFPNAGLTCASSRCYNLDRDWFITVWLVNNSTYAVYASCTNENEYGYFTIGW